MADSLSRGMYAIICHIWRVASEAVLSRVNVMDQYQTWKVAALALCDEARKGVVVVEGPRERLCYENRENLVKERKDRESRKEKMEFRARTEKEKALPGGSAFVWL